MPLLKNIFNLPVLTLLVALSLSAIAAWYSILGLTAIFAAAVIPIIIMGSALEIAKVVSTVWLHRYWNKAGWTIKLYLVPAVTALALLTSMGIFGFLSKAHVDQGVPTGDVAAQVALIDEKIANERQNIDSAKALLRQMDDAVIGINASKDKDIKQRDGSVYSQSGAERAFDVRKSQAKDRADTTSQIEIAQRKIIQFQAEKAPIASELRKVEAEVGPIRYVAALIYGDNPDANLLERAVRWMIILIVVVFDPLALTLVIAAQHSFRWMREERELTEQDDHNSSYTEFDDSNSNTGEDCPKCKTPMLDAPGIGLFCPNKECNVFDNPYGYLQEQADSIKFVEPATNEPIAAPESNSSLEQPMTSDLAKDQPLELTELTEKENSSKVEPIIVTELPNVEEVVNDVAYEQDNGPLTEETLAQVQETSNMYLTEEEILVEKDTSLVPDTVVEEPVNDIIASDGTIIASDVVLDEVTIDLGSSEVEVSNEIDLADMKVVEDVVTPVEKEPDIKTEGITLNETDGGYIQYDGKSVQKNALKEMHPELFTLTADSINQISTNFGTYFPKIAKKGDVFVRVDMLPNRVFKFDGYKWIEVNKDQSDSYLYDEEYIVYLIDKLNNGEYDIDLLSENERAQIELYLKK